MSLTRNEVIRLLAVVAALDDRDTDDDLLINAWHAMSIEGDWPSFAAARRALMVYRTEHPDYPVRPGHITQTVQRVREQARRSFVPPTDRDMPEEVLSDPAAYQRYMLDAARRHQDAVLAAFAGGQRVLAIAGAS